MNTAKMIVFTAAMPGQANALARWYNETHIPDLLAVPGVVHAERHTLRKLKAPEGMPVFDFLAIYTLKGDDIDAVIGDAARRMGTADMPASPALDSSKTLAYIAIEARAE